MSRAFILAEGFDLDALLELHAAGGLRLVTADGGFVHANGSSEALVDLLLREARIAGFIRADVAKLDNTELLGDVLRDAERRAGSV